ncbi:hypothetical protein JTB14_005887 [Gonioctena quinquepunctata]|nr:hypothetical protein JTB14_005887 [Gonioctena quinquepunctata]
MDVSADNPFELSLGENEADGETLLDSSHPAKLENRGTVLRSPDSVIQEVAETLPCSSEPKVLEITENRGMFGSPDLIQEGVETLRCSSHLKMEENRKTLQSSSAPKFDNEFEMDLNLDVLDITGHVAKQENVNSVVTVSDYRQGNPKQAHDEEVSARQNPPKLSRT